MLKDRRLPSRFWSKVEVSPEGCWLWTAALSTGGYAKFAWDGKSQYGHRVAYERFVGPLVEGLEIDHLCRNRRCVNPQHLDQVTGAENQRRSPVSPAGINARKQSCKCGREYTPHPTTPGRRICIPCRRAGALASFYRRKAATV